MTTIWTPPTSPRYSTADLLRHAHERGFKQASESLVKEWRRLGLLDTPRREWPGRGKGSASWYMQRQLELWLALLDQRFHKHAPIGALYKVPVFGWLYWAANSGVSLQQVQRAMATWLNVSSVPRSYRVARQTATLVVRNHASPRAKGHRREVVDQLADFIYQGGYPPEADLRELFGLVMDPDRRSEVRGPALAPLSAESTSVVIHARCTAGEQIQSTPDALWEWARISYHWVMQHYQALYPEFAADPQTGHLFERPDLEMIANKACFLLLTHLGTGLLVIQERWRPDGLPPELHPSLWLAGQVTGTVEPRTSSLVLPSGAHPLYLRIAVTAQPQRESTDERR